MDEQQLERDNKRYKTIEKAVKAIAKKKSQRFTERRRDHAYNLDLKRIGGDE